MKILVMLFKNRFCSLISCLHKPLDLHDKSSEEQAMRMMHCCWKAEEYIYIASTTGNARAAQVKPTTSILGWHTATLPT